MKEEEIRAYLATLYHGDEPELIELSAEDTKLFDDLTEDLIKVEPTQNQ